MAIFLKDIYEDTKQTFGIELIAGTKGLDKIMTWVYVTEDVTTSDFLHGGELVITTGALCQDCDRWLLEFLKHMVEQHVCGLVVNTGKYIQRTDISAEILDYCERESFALFVMPWETHIYDITKEYYNRIFLDTNRHTDISNAFLSLLNQHEPEAEALSLLADYRFLEEVPYYVAVISLSEGEMPLPQNRSALPGGGHLFHLLQGQLINAPCPCHLIVRNYSFYLICQCEHFEVIHSLTLQIQAQLRTYLKEQTPAVGIGGMAKDLRHIAGSCQQASAAMKMGLHKGMDCFLYEDMGFFKLLLAVEDRSVLEDYAAQHLGLLHNYDKEHHSDYARTLYLYLLNQNSIQGAADASFCHRNTVNHRIRFMKEQMGLELEDAMECLELMTAFLIEEYLGAF